MKCLIIEDEPLAAKRLSRFLNDYSTAMQVVSIVPSIQKAIDFLENNEAPDLLLMDIQLEDGISFNIFDKTSITSPVIFTTAYHEYAISAFKVNAVDFLLKPLKKGELFTALDKVFKNGNRNPSLEEQDPSVPTLIVKYGSRYYLTRTNEISCIYRKENMGVLLRHDGLKFPIHSDIDELAETLKEFNFIRVTDHLLVHIDSILKLSYQKNMPRIQLDLTDFDEEIEVKGKYVTEFNNWIKTHPI